MTTPLNTDLLEHAADLISQADALIVAAGASHALVVIDRLMRAVSPELFHKRTTELKSIAASS